MSDDRFITRTTFEDGDEVTSHYDKRSGLIYETRVPSMHISLDDLVRDLGIGVDELVSGTYVAEGDDEDRETDKQGGRGNEA